MALRPKPVLAPLARQGRTVASAVIAAFRRSEDPETVEARLRRLPARDQALIVGGVLAGMFLTSLLAAQFGIVGVLAFVLAVIILVR